MDKPTHGGKRKGAGRPSRSEPKSKSIWCGQVLDDEREYILKTLTPEERLIALLNAAQVKNKNSHER